MARFYISIIHNIDIHSLGGHGKTSAVMSCSKLELQVLSHDAKVCGNFSLKQIEVHYEGTYPTGISRCSSNKYSTISTVKYSKVKQYYQPSIRRERTGSSWYRSQAVQCLCRWCRYSSSSRFPRRVSFRRIDGGRTVDEPTPSRR